MKAAVYRSYGDPEVVQVKQMAIPKVGAHDVLIRVQATTVTAGDWRMRRADPFVIRLMNGLRAPKQQVLGHEFAGTVEAVGDQVIQFAPGDAVYGSTGFAAGAHATYVCVAANGALARIPAGLTMAEAASVPVGALTALHFLQKAQVEVGHRVLIYGASGSIGTAAVQLAKHMGADVTAVCSTRNIALVKELGADAVVDYTKHDYASLETMYDVIFDTVGKSSYWQARRVLAAGGTYVASSPGIGDYLQLVWVNRFSTHRIVAGMAKETPDALQHISDLIAQGQYAPVIDRRYPMYQIVEAHRYAESGHKRGNVVIEL
ncbi:MAG: NAD(P)-dependent alcohol dehydrogenase [Rhodothermales bacterium]